jgi:DNA-binding NarL/FixJ family response regulator
MQARPREAVVQRLLVVDQHPVIGVALGKILEADANVIVEVLTDPVAAERAIAAGSVDVIVSEIGFSGESRGLGLLPALRPNRPPVVVLTGLAHPSLIRAALDRGAAAVVSKTAAVGEIAGAIRAVAQGKSFVSPTMLQIARRARRRPAPREMAVLREVAIGSTNTEVAKRLGIRQPTVEAVLRRLFNRYDVRNRTALTRVAAEEGWLLESAA